MYFSGNDVTLYISKGGGLSKELLDAVSVQFSINHPTSPVYSHGDRQFKTQMIGTKLIHGSISLNYKEGTNLLALTDKGYSELYIMYAKTAYDNTVIKGKRYKGAGEYTAETSYCLKGIEITARQHVVTPNAENIVNNYQFIARSFIGNLLEETM